MIETECPFCGAEGTHQVLVDDEDTALVECCSCRCGFLVQLC